jgi:hypothetical protein
MKKFTAILMVFISLHAVQFQTADQKVGNKKGSCLTVLAAEVKESSKIVAGSILAACLYGIINDSVTVRVCPEYFTEGFHKEMLRPWWKSGPNSKITDMLLNPNNKTLISLYWGTFTTWWVGAGLGALNVAAARVGSWPKVSMSELAKPLAKSTFGLLGASLAAGIYGYRGAQNNAKFVQKMKSLMQYPDMPNAIVPFYSANLYAHHMGYFGGAVVGLSLMYHTLKLRYAKAQEAKQDQN